VRRLVLISVLFACGSPPARQPFLLRVAMWGPLGKLTPESGDTDSLAVIAQPWVFEPLARFDAAGELVPVLAWRIAALQGGRFQVELRKDRTFSDGAGVTTDDVVNSFEGKARISAANGGLTIESVDRAMPIEALLTDVHIHRDHGGQVLGTGPFAVSAASASELRLVRRRTDPGKVDEVRILAYATPREAFAHTLKGDANLIPDLEPRWVEFFGGVPSLKIVRSPGHFTDSVLFNLRLSRSERLDLAARLESNDIRDAAYGPGECAETKSGTSPAARIPPGAALEVMTWGPFERLGSAARRSLGPRAGALTNLTPLEVLARLRAGQFDLVTVRPPVWPPSAISLAWHSGARDNLSGYSNPAVDRALDARDWAAARAAMRADPPAAFICTRDRLAVVDARIKNPTLGPGDLLETLPDWEVSQ
jgi:hypothetical protein